MGCPEKKDEGCCVPCEVQTIVDQVNSVLAMVDALDYELCCGSDPDALTDLPALVVDADAFVKEAKCKLATIPTGCDDTEWTLVDACCKEEAAEAEQAAPAGGECAGEGAAPAGGGGCADAAAAAAKPAGCGEGKKEGCEGT